MQGRTQAHLPDDAWGEGAHGVRPVEAALAHAPLVLGHRVLRGARRAMQAARLPDGGAHSMAATIRPISSLSLASGMVTLPALSSRTFPGLPCPRCRPGRMPGGPARDRDRAGRRGVQERQNLCRGHLDFHRRPSCDCRALPPCACLAQCSRALRRRAQSPERRSSPALLFLCAAVALLLGGLCVWSLSCVRSELRCRAPMMRHCTTVCYRCVYAVGV